MQGPREESGSERPKRLKLGELLIEAGLLEVKDLERALELQKATRVQLGRILVSLGMVRRYDLHRILAEQWRMPFIDLVAEQPDPELVRKFDYETLIDKVFVPVRQRGNKVDVAVTQSPSIEIVDIISNILGNVEIVFHVTTEWDVDHIVRSAFRQQLLDGAIYGLYYRKPHESAYTVFTKGQFVVFSIATLACLLSFFIAPRLTSVITISLINIGFATSILFKFYLSLKGAVVETTEQVSDEEVALLKDEDLPIYTILLPVFKEAGVIDLLITNLMRLDYPMEKIEVLVLLEENDEETLTAAKSASPPGNVHFVIVPHKEPKTKPKACNVGLFFARGEYTVIYDAEDRPEPDQLKKALVAFRKGPENLACIQCALNYFNSRENFLTRLFTLEYSYWFDYMLPGLDQARLPIPLGGTSNHFKTDILRELGGWDPFNVTEDADLGVRAAAEGYTVSILNSTTFEESTSTVGNWLRQRSRWIKGYMQTGLVYMRDPLRLFRQIGLRRAISFFLLVPGTPLLFLFAPPLWILYIWWLITESYEVNALFPPALLYLSMFNLLIGNCITVYLCMLAVFKRGQYHLILWSLLNPLYWVLHSIASYKALGQLFTKPFFWEKTTHGFHK